MSVIERRQIRRFTEVSIIAFLVISCSAIDKTNRGAQDSTEFHYTGKYCTKCHEQTPEKNGRKFLKFGGDLNKLCYECHLKTRGSYIHPADMEPSNNKRIKIPDDLPLQNGKITCLTCHNIYRQCQKRRFYKNSLRGKPLRNRSAFCFKCHDARYYKRLNAHTHLNEEGKIVAKKCLYCHEEKPDERQASFEDVAVIGDFKTLCERCHDIDGNHAGNVNHLKIKPSAKALGIMRNMIMKFNIVLPLDPEGRLTCVTCHNPHERGVIPEDKPGAKGAGSKFRHRLPGRICIECHIDIVGGG